MTNRQTVRYSLLDIIKGVSIVFVIITHQNWEDAQRLKYFFPYWINMAVALFMIVSGYVNAISFIKKDINTYEKAYNKTLLINKVLRYTIPFLFIYIYECIYKCVILQNRCTVINIINDFLVGGSGPGSYYFPVIIQLIFIFPIIYFILKRYKVKGLYLCLIINIIFEILKTAYHMNVDCYRLLVFRYIFFVAIGIYLYLYDIKSKIALIGMFVVGAIYIFIICYRNYKPIYLSYWSGRTFVSCFYIFPIFYLILKLFNNIKFLSMEIIGKASYYIYLFQMLYYNIWYKSILGCKFSRKVNLFLSLLICIFVGLVLYLIINPFVKIINNKVKSITKK